MPYLAWLLPNNLTVHFRLKNHLHSYLTHSQLRGCSWLALVGSIPEHSALALNNCAPRHLSFLQGLASLGVQLVYAQFYDVYLIQFLPFVLLALGLMCPRWPNWLKATIGWYVGCRTPHFVALGQKEIWSEPKPIGGRPKSLIPPARRPKTLPVT